MDSEKKYEIHMADPYFGDEDRKYIHAQLEKVLSGSLSMGPNVKALENSFAQYQGCSHAIAMNSCTSTLEAAIVSLGIKPGDEILVPVETFIATGMAVYLAGAVPIFVEISAKTFCLDLEDAKKKVTPKTKGIITVHMAGLIDNSIFKIKEFCNENKLFLIEDCAHAPGAKLDGIFAGNFGDVGCFSLFPTKVFTGGEGGILVTKHDRVASVVRSLQHRGRDMESEEECYIRPGRNVRMTEMAAVLARCQLLHLDEYLTSRRNIAQIYINHLKNDSRVNLVIPSQMEASSFWKFIILLNSDQRTDVAKYMKKKGISVDFAYNPPLHLQPVFREIYGTQKGDLPISEALLSRHICLPCHQRISTEAALYIVETLKEALACNGGE